MKKLLASLLILILVFSFVGCGKESTDSQDEKFSPFTAIDTDECSVSVDKVAEDDGDTDVTLTLENKTSDKTLVFKTDSGSCDGLDNEPYFYVEVEPGQKVTEDATYYAIEVNELSGFSDLYMGMVVCDSADDSAEYANEDFHIYPYGKSKATVYEHKAGSSDIQIADNDSLSMIYVGRHEAIQNNPVFYIENKSETGILIVATATDVNGQAIEYDERWYVTPGGKRFADCRFINAELSDLGLSSWESMSFTFTGEDDDYNIVLDETTAAVN